MSNCLLNVVAQHLRFYYAVAESVKNSRDVVFLCLHFKRLLPISSTPCVQTTKFPAIDKATPIPNARRSRNVKGRDHKAGSLGGEVGSVWSPWFRGRIWFRMAESQWRPMVDKEVASVAGNWEMVSHTKTSVRRRRHSCEELKTRKEEKEQ